MLDDMLDGAEVDDIPSLSRSSTLYEKSPPRIYPRTKSTQTKRPRISLLSDPPTVNSLLSAPVDLLDAHNIMQHQQKIEQRPMKTKPPSNTLIDVHMEPISKVKIISGHAQGLSPPLPPPSKAPKLVRSTPQVPNKNNRRIYVPQY
jgi:hypothetical protein